MALSEKHRFAQRCQNAGILGHGRWCVCVCVCARVCKGGARRERMLGRNPRLWHFLEIAHEKAHPFSCCGIFWCTSLPGNTWEDSGSHFQGVCVWEERETPVERCRKKWETSREDGTVSLGAPSLPQDSQSSAFCSEEGSHHPHPQPDVPPTSEM